MKESIELRIHYDYANLLFRPDEGKHIGRSVKIVELSKNDPRYNQVPIIADEVKRKFDKGFFFGWDIKRSYSKIELKQAKLFRLKIRNTFQPTGEECGTTYDKATACEICGANWRQKSGLMLKKGSIPKKDIAKTIGGEVVVSEEFVYAARQRSLKGLHFGPVNIEKYYQLTSDTEVGLSHRTVAGINPWNLSEGSNGNEFTVSADYPVKIDKEVYKCPKGHTIGLNLLSESYVLDDQFISECDFFASRQKVGVKRGLLRPESVYFCSQAFKKMIKEEKLTGFEFEIANIE